VYSDICPAIECTHCNILMLCKFPLADDALSTHCHLHCHLSLSILHLLQSQIFLILISSHTKVIVLCGPTCQMALINLNVLQIKQLISLQFLKGCNQYGGLVFHCVKRACRYQQRKCTFSNPKQLPGKLKINIFLHAFSTETRPLFLSNDTIVKTHVKLHIKHATPLL